MISMTLAECARATQSQTTHPQMTFTGISKDNRETQAGNLFVALLGENYDSHQFVNDAYQKGATAALVSKPVECEIPQLIVPDTILALGALSQHWRNQFSIPLIGVTGSNGKTTLKNMIASILLAASHGNTEAVLSTEGNLNNTIGLPFTLAKLNASHRLGVIEMGMNIPGEIRYLTRLTRPQIAVVNNAAESHLAGVKDLAGVAREKGEIFSGLASDGVAILNRDDQFYHYWLKQTESYKRMTFGWHSEADVSANIVSTTHAMQHLSIHTPMGEIDVRLPLLGQHNALNALAACAATLALNIDLSIIRQGLETIHAAKGRMNLHTLKNNLHIIDDTYNANPFSTHAAIKTLANEPGTKILVLADMRELGVDEIALHTLTGQRAREAGIDYVFTLGELSKATAEAFGQNGKAFHDQESLTAALHPYLQANTTLLIKGSRSMHMEHIVKNLLTVVTLD